MDAGSTVAQKVEEPMAPDANTGNTGVPVQASGPHHHIRFPGQNGGQNKGDFWRKMLSVSIQKDDCLRVEAARCLQAGPQGFSLSLILFVPEDERTSHLSDLRCRIGGAVVHHNHCIHILSGL